MKKLSYIAFIYFIIACNQQNNEENLVAITPENLDSPLSISSISNRVEFLEVKSERPIAGTPNILIGETFYYLFDQDYTTSIYQIDKEKGIILNTIKFGTDDIINSNSITSVVIKDNQIGIIQNGLNVTWFDENLHEVGNEKLLVKAKYQFPYNNDYLAFTNSINDLIPWDFIAYDDKIKTKALPINEDTYKFVYQSSSPFSKWKDNVVFAKYFNDTVYSYNGQKLNPLFVIDFGIGKVPDDEFSKIKNAMDMMRFFGEKKYTYLSGDIFSISDDLIMTEYIDKGNRKIGIWSESRNTFNSYLSLYDDLLSNIILYTPSVVKEKELAFGVTGESILENYNDLSPTFKSKLSEDYATSYFIFLAYLK